MGEAGDCAGISGSSRIDLLARTAALCDGVRRIPDPAQAVSFVRHLDTLLVALAHGRGALDIAIGERLDALSVGDRAMELGSVTIGDYARERLGMPASTAQKMARLARGLRDAPLLREAVRSGEVSCRQAEAVLPVARGEAEAGWVERARSETVRSLKAAVKEAVPDEEPFERLCVDVPPERRAVLDEALDLAGQLLGATAAKWQRVEALCQEYLSDHPGQELPVAPPEEDWIEHAQAWVEQENKRWSSLFQTDDLHRAAGRAAAGRGGEDVRAWRFHRGHARPTPFSAAASVRRRPERLRKLADAPRMPFPDRRAFHRCLESLCAAHHQRGIHMGRVRVRGRAPDDLTWELGVQAGCHPSPCTDHLRSDAQRPLAVFTFRGGQGAPASAHVLKACTNWSCVIDTGFRP